MIFNGGYPEFNPDPAGDPVLHSFSSLRGKVHVVMFVVAVMEVLLLLLFILHKLVSVSAVDILSIHPRTKVDDQSK